MLLVRIFLSNPNPFTPYFLKYYRSDHPIDQRSLSGDLIEPATQVVDEHGEAMLLFEAMKFGWEMRSENVKQVDDESNF